MVIRALLRTLLYFGLSGAAWGSFIYAGIMIRHAVAG